MVHQENVDGGGTVIVRDALGLKEIPNETGVDLAQADVRASHNRYSPWVAPTIAMKHRQPPQVAALTAPPCLDVLGAVAEAGATMRVPHAFRAPPPPRPAVTTPTTSLL